MKAKELRHKLIVDFGEFIQDDSKLEMLEGVFDAIKNQESLASVSKEHYDKVLEERTLYISDISKLSSWEEVEQRLNTKYGF